MSGFGVLRRIKRRYLDLRILIRYGTANPRVVKLADGRHEVSINPADPRARKKVASDAIRGKQRRNQVFWIRAIKTLQPNVALDVGVNFGECLFQTDYPAGTLAYGIDGNPALLPYLRESRDLHPSASQIELHNALVSDAPGEAAAFYVSKRASGGSTAVEGVAEMRDGDFEEVQVPVTSVDTLLEGRADTVVFKIDVEGFEGNVLRGMSGTIDNCKTALGFIEFDTRMLQRAGEDLPGLWAYLQSKFDIHMFVGARLVNLSNDKWETAAAHCVRTGDHTDLLLIGGSERQAGRDFVMSQFAEPSHRAA